MKLLSSLLPVSALLAAQPGLAADAAEGKRIAASRCAPCHVIEQNQNATIAESPPFEVIASKFRSNPESLPSFILSPHAKMNMTITPREATDVAAYIWTLVR